MFRFTIKSRQFALGDNVVSFIVDFMSKISKTLIIVLLSFMLATASHGENEWPCFHGPDRTNRSAETGLLNSWPRTGPRLLWTATGLGEGYSTVSIAEGKIFAAGNHEKRTYVYSYDLNGKLLWKTPNGPAWSTLLPWARSYTGSRSTPTYDEGVVYHLSETGRLAAFDSQTGKELWFTDIVDRFGGNIPQYGYSESILIYGNRLFCSPAGKKGFIVCLDKRNGSLIWANTEIPGSTGYSSTILAESNGYLQVISMSSNSAYGVDSATGRLLWTVPHRNKRSNNCTDPIFHNGHVFISSGYGGGCMLIRLRSSGTAITPETVWETKLMDNHHGGVILHDGYFYGSGDESRGWFCLDFKTGKEMWRSRGKGSLTYADNMLYLLEENGSMKLAGATYESYQEQGSFRVPSGGSGMYWAHPVICGGRLYIRHDDKLFAYDIRGK